MDKSLSLAKKLWKILLDLTLDWQRLEAVKISTSSAEKYSAAFSAPLTAIFLAGPPLHTIGGARKLFGGLVLEAGGGTGVNGENGCPCMILVSARYLLF